MKLLILVLAMFGMHSGPPDYELLGRRQYAYNESGLRSEKISFDAEGRLEGKVYYFCDENGHKIRTEKYSAEDSLAVVYEYQFTEKGEKAGSLKTDYAKGRKSRKAYFYNANGQVIRCCYYAEGCLLKSITYAYDELGNQNRYEVRNAKGERITLWLTSYRYDEKGQLIEKRRSDEEGNLLKVCSYGYNAKGQIETGYTDYYNGKRRNSKRVYTYNDEGQKIGFTKFALRRDPH